MGGGMGMGGMGGMGGKGMGGKGGMGGGFGHMPPDFNNPLHGLVPGQMGGPRGGPEKPCGGGIVSARHIIDPLNPSRFFLDCPADRGNQLP